MSENEVPNNPEEAGGADSELQFSGHIPSVEDFFFLLMKPTPHICVVLLK